MSDENKGLSALFKVGDQEVMADSIHRVRVGREVLPFMVVAYYENSNRAALVTKGGDDIPLGLLVRVDFLEPETDRAGVRHFGYKGEVRFETTPLDALTSAQREKYLDWSV